MSVFSIDVKEIEKIQEMIAKMADGRAAEQEINQYLLTEGGELIKVGIQALLPVSGRSWAGKNPPASAVDPFTVQGGNLSVTVRTRNGYHYLYFPDDGSDTKRHIGNQNFMFQGAINKETEITNGVIERLLKKMEG